MTLRIGISTCPNDTFAFAALLERRVDGPELAFTLDDVEALNEQVVAGRLDVAKASFHAALLVAEDYLVLPVGSALGFGVGPLLLARPGLCAASPGPEHRVLCPGRYTTAALLYRLYFPDAAPPRHLVFSAIMPALARGDADFGVVIHEGRFTYEEHGLDKVADLGELWERETAAPLPLGGILARRDLGAATQDRVSAAIRASLHAARADPARALPTMARYAQEHSQAVLEEHVRLYVTEATEDLGEAGWSALDTLARKAAEVGVTPGVRTLR